MYVVAFVLLAVAHGCLWLIYRFTHDLKVFQITFELFTGEPDSIGAYEVTTLTRTYGPKR